MNAGNCTEISTLRARSLNSSRWKLHLLNHATCCTMLIECRFGCKHVCGAATGRKGKFREDRENTNNLVATKSRVYWIYELSVRGLKG